MATERTGKLRQDIQPFQVNIGNIKTFQTDTKQNLNSIENNDIYNLKNEIDSIQNETGGLIEQFVNKFDEYHKIDTNIEQIPSPIKGMIVFIKG